MQINFVARRRLCASATVACLIGCVVFMKQQRPIMASRSSRSEVKWLASDAFDLHGALDTCRVHARHVTTKQLEILDKFFAPLARDTASMQRYGRDASLLLRITCPEPLSPVQVGSSVQIAQLRVEKGLSSAPWTHEIPVLPEDSVEIPAGMFRGGRLYFMQRLFGPQNAIGDEGVLDDLTATEWHWRVTAAAVFDDVAGQRLKEVEEPANEKACDPISAQADSEALGNEVVSVARFVSGRDIRVLDVLFAERCDSTARLMSDDDLYVALRLHTRQSLGEKRTLVRAVADVCSDDWPHADLAFPVQACRLDFIELEDGVVYFVKRVENVNAAWGNGGERDTLLSRLWKVRLRRVVIK